MNEKRFPMPPQSGENEKDMVRATANLRHVFDNLVSENEPSQINMREFIGNCYDKSEVVADINGLETESKEYSDIIKRTLRETVFLLGQKFNWFGKDAHTGQTSKYDQKSGADLVIAFDDGEEIPLAINLIVNQAEQKLPPRINESLNIKYYQSPIDPETRCEIDAIPVTVDFTEDEAEDLIKTINELVTLGNRGYANETDTARVKQLEFNLTKHPLKNKMLENILSRLEHRLAGAKKSDVNYVEKINLLCEKLAAELNAK